MSGFSVFGPAFSFHHQPRPANMSRYQAFIRPEQNQNHVFNMGSFQGMQSSTLTPASHVIPVFNAQAYPSVPFLPAYTNLH